MDLPVNVDTGTVVGRYVVKVIDGVDPNQEPDAVPVRGRIVFTASVPYLPDPSASPDPVTIMTAPIVGVLDAEGYLCTPYSDTGEPMYRGVKLAATDDPDLAVQNWTWDVTYIFEPSNGHKLAIPAHGFSLPSGETIDLTKVAKVPSSPGYSLPQAEAAVLRAEAIAQSIRDDADNGVFNGEAATVVVGTVTSGATPDVVNAGDEQHAILNFTLEKGEKGDTGTGVPDAGDALQVMRMDSAGAATEWVTPTKAIVGLSNVDNTADADKPVSGPTELALGNKADLESGKVPETQIPERLSTAALSAAIDGSVSPVKRRTRRDIEQETTGIVRRATIPAGLGWDPGVPILTDGNRYWSPVDVETMRPAGGKTFYISSSHGASSGSGQDLGTLTAPVASGETVTSLAITASAQATNSTAKLAVIVGTEWVPVTVSASVAAGATTVSVQSLTPGFTLPRGSKLVAVRNRLHDIYGPTLNYVAAGDTVVFLDKVNYYNAIQALTENKGIGLVGIRPGTIISMSEKETWTLTSGNVHQASRTNVRTLVDIAADKDGFEYTRVSSVAECEALPGSWFQATDGTGAVYVRTLQGGAPNPETHHALLTTENIGFTPPGGSTVFLKNLRFIGGLDTVMVDGSEATPVRFLVKDCEILWGGYGPVGATDATIASSLHIRGNVEAYMQRLRVGHSTRDAIDYVGLSGYKPRFMEIDCEAFACGVNSISLAVDPTNATFNASSAHDGAVGIRVGGKYHDSRGTVVADVHVGTKSANYGLDAWGSTATFDLFNAAISAQQDGTEMWLYGCRAWGTKNDIVAVGTAVVHVLGETEYDSIGGTGSILAD